MLMLSPNKLRTLASTLVFLSVSSAGCGTESQSDEGESESAALGPEDPLA